MKWFQRWSVYRQVMRELNRLDDRDLRDLGFTRADFDSIARLSANEVK